MSVESLSRLYNSLRISYGFVTDDDFMQAWSENPSKYASLFHLRMNLIEAISRNLSI